MRQHSRAKYRRLILIYSLVIIVPGTFLSILAYRGIYGDLAMADRIIENRLERKSRYFFGGMEDDIERCLDAVSSKDVILEYSQVRLAAGNSASTSFQEGLILAAAFKMPDDSIRFINQISHPGLSGIDLGAHNPGDIAYHLKKNINVKYDSKSRTQPPYVDFYNDTMSVLLVTQLSPEFNLALLLDTRELMMRNIPVLDETQGFPQKIVWRILDEYGNELWKDPGFKGRDPKAFNNLGRYGNWILQLEQVKSSPLNVVQEAEQQLFVIGFIFVIVVMAIGLVLTIRSLTMDYKFSQLKSDFVSTVSHEFKSPLTSIRMMSERLASKKVKKEERRIEYYKSMLAQSERLSHLVENILDFSRMDRGKKTYNFELWDLTKPAKEVIDYLTLRHGDEGFDITLSSALESPEAMVDYQGVYQVLYNLIENAIKYSGESRKVDVRITKSRNYIRISIRDFGIGISKKDRKRIFGQFYRVSGAGASGISGSGIGLSIVNEIIKAHNGRIELESEVGKGSVFTVYIPVTQK